MDSSSGNSSQIHNSGSEEDLLDQRKRKRMESNRESARRSRIRKQKHLGDLTAQINQLKNVNSHIITTIKVTTQKFLQIEQQNFCLRAQMDELSQSLDSLNEIMNRKNNYSSDYCTNGTSGMFGFELQSDFFNHPWNLIYINHQPIMASATDVLQY